MERKPFVQPSIIIGLGGMGCQVAAQIYRSFSQFCENTGADDYRMQFLLIDSMPPAEDTNIRELRDRGDYLSIGERDARGLLHAYRHTDPFWDEWWPDVNDPGDCSRGCATIPAHGRLLFWGNVIDQISDKYLQKYDTSLRNSTEDFVNVFIICTASGGTGSGMFIDVGQLIRNHLSIQRPAAINLVLMMPSIPALIAQPEIRHQLEANGYGSLIGLNYWLTPEHQRNYTIEPYMRSAQSGIILDSTEEPFECVFLISRNNAGGKEFLGVEEYYEMIAEVVGQFVYRPESSYLMQFINKFYRLISVPTNPYKFGSYAQPRRYASFASYQITYSPDKAIQYLSDCWLVKALDNFLQNPEKLSQTVDNHVHNFLKGLKMENSNELDRLHPVEIQRHLRRVKPDELFLYDELELWIRDIEIKENKTHLINQLSNRLITKDNLVSTVQRWKAHIEQMLESELDDHAGVSLHSILSRKLELLVDGLVSGAKSREAYWENHEVPIYDYIESLLKNPNMALCGTIEFVTQLKQKVEQHQECLQEEIEGSKPNRTIGLRQKLNELETIFIPYLTRILKPMMFGGFSLRSRTRRAGRSFHEDWWDECLQLKIEIMVKEYVMRFYEKIKIELNHIERFLRDHIIQELYSLHRL